VLNIVCTLLSEVQKEHLRSSELSNFTLSESIKDKAEQPLASAYMLYLYELHKSHISDQELGTQRAENYQKVVRYIIANTRREILVLVGFQDDYYSINYWIIY